MQAGLSLKFVSGDYIVCNEISSNLYAAGTRTIPVVWHRHDMALEVTFIVGNTRNARRVLACASLTARRAASLLGCCDNTTVRREAVTHAVVGVDEVSRSDRVPCREEVSEDAAEDDSDDNVAVERHGNQHDEVLCIQEKKESRKKSQLRITRIRADVGFGMVGNLQHQ